MSSGSATVLASSPPKQDGGRHHVYLHPGQLHAAAEPTEVTTVLGSCVAVCLWDPEARVGGVNHYTLPLPPGGDRRSPRFAEGAIAVLLEQVLSLGGVKRHLRAKVCGGGGSLGGGLMSGRSLGLQNVEVARERLTALGIPILAEDVGGSRGRKLIFQTDTGIAWVKRL